MNTYLNNMIMIVITIAVLAGVHILGSIYYNLGKEVEKFEPKKLLKGLTKVLIVVAIISGITYVWIIYTKLGIVSDELIDPYVICYLTSLYYFIKATAILIKIFGVEEYLKTKLGK
ncbi:hypothetical protein [Anaerorhabdus sp.]|uniref:hypothetical protein n=1 Tax=Anaerorhabdus sp. TaxID=1872524 RepID=UPI002FC7BC9E